MTEAKGLEHLVGEDRALAEVFGILTGADTARFEVPPGHDCAVLSLPSPSVVVTTDVLVDGVHFELHECGAEAAAAKSLLVNLSDLAAAAAQPIAFEVGVVLPSDRADDLLLRLARGLADVAARYGCPCAGGDTNVADGPLTLAVTALGAVGPGGPITRAGARVGDVLSVTGALGGSLHGRHLSFVPRLAEARVLAQHGVAHAMMDLSDGVSRDLPRLCRASGVGARVEAQRIPVHDDAPQGDAGLRAALDDGEDFELLVAHAPLDDAQRAALGEAGVNLHEIGRVTDAADGVVLRTRDGDRPLRARGFDHLLGGDRAPVPDE